MSSCKAFIKKLSGEGIEATEYKKNYSVMDDGDHKLPHYQDINSEDDKVVNDFKKAVALNDLLTLTWQSMVSCVD